MFFVLDENKKVKEATIEEYRDFFSIYENKVVKKSKSSSYHTLVSTVFLGIPHNGGMFETMIFRNDNLIDIYCERCETWNEAEKQHEIAIKWAVDNGFM